MPASPTYPDIPFSSTVKDKRGDLHTFRGMNYDEWYDNGAQLVGGTDNMDKIIGEINDRIAAEAPAPSSAPAAQSSGGEEWKSNPPTCQHGEMRAQQWTGKSGPNKDKPQYTFFCPLPREAPAGDKCSPIDALTRKPWGSK